MASSLNARPPFFALSPCPAYFICLFILQRHNDLTMTASQYLSYDFFPQKYHVVTGQRWERTCGDPPVQPLLLK